MPNKSGGFWLLLLLVLFLFKLLCYMFNHFLLWGVFDKIFYWMENFISEYISLSSVFDLLWMIWIFFLKMMDLMGWMHLLMFFSFLVYCMMEVLMMWLFNFNFRYIYWCLYFFMHTKMQYMLFYAKKEEKSQWLFLFCMLLLFIMWMMLKINGF